MSLRACEGTRKDGRPCGNPATADGYCFAHSPAYRDKTAAARAEGGRNSSRTVRAKKRMKTDLQTISSLIDATLAGVYKGSLRPAQGQAIAALVGAKLKVYEVAELTVELQDLKDRMEGLRRWRA